MTPYMLPQRWVVVFEGCPEPTSSFKETLIAPGRLWQCISLPFSKTLLNQAALYVEPFGVQHQYHCLQRPSYTVQHQLSSSFCVNLMQVGVLGDEITNASNVVAKGRLGPGQMVLADIVDGKFAGESCF